MFLVDGDRIPIFTSEDGVPVQISASDVRFASNEPESVIIASERKRRYPDPVDDDAKSMYAEIRQRFNSGEPYLATAKCQEFEKLFGWFGPVALYEVLANEAIGGPFRDSQDRLIRIARGVEEPEQLCQLAEPLLPEHQNWLLGLVFFTRAEDARQRGDFDAALTDMDASYMGLTDDPLDDEARVKRTILLNYLRAKLGHPDIGNQLLQLRQQNHELFEHVLSTLKLEIDDL